MIEYLFEICLTLTLHTILGYIAVFRSNRHPIKNPSMYFLRYIVRRRRNVFLEKKISKKSYLKFPPSSFENCEETKYLLLHHFHSSHDLLVKSLFEQYLTVSNINYVYRLCISYTVYDIQYIIYCPYHMLHCENSRYLKIVSNKRFSNE